MKLRRTFGIFLLLMLFSCTDRRVEQEETNDSSLAKIIVNNELVVGIDPSVPPLSFYSSSGGIIGYEVDVAQTIADKLGVKLRLVPVTVETRINELENRAIDYIASGFINNARNAERFLLSTPYVRDALIVVVAQSFTGEMPYRTFADLRNKRIGLVADEEIGNIVINSPLYEHSSRQPYFYPRLENLLIALDYGQLEAVIINLLTYYSKITKEKKSYRPIGDPLVIATYSYALRKGDDELLKTINLLLNDMAQDGTLRAISTKWFGADVSIVGKY